MDEFGGERVARLYCSKLIRKTIIPKPVGILVQIDKPGLSGTLVIEGVALQLGSLGGLKEFFYHSDPCR